MQWGPCTPLDPAPHKMATCVTPVLHIHSLAAGWLAQFLWSVGERRYLGEQCRIAVWACRCPKLPLPSMWRADALRPASWFTFLTVLC